MKANNTVYKTNTCLFFCGDFNICIYCEMPCISKRRKTDSTNGKNYLSQRNIEYFSCLWLQKLPWQPFGHPRSEMFKRHLLCV